MVGAVVVKEDQIVGEGFHVRAGAPHAEIIALQKAGEAARGADLYVTLEPCCHYGRTPPCVDAVISAGISRVFAALIDPNPKVSGQGLAALEKAGICLHVGMLEERSRRLNESYIKYVSTGLPFVTLKMAMTLDGKIASRTGDSKWISAEASRKCVHRLRARSDAVIVGLGTVLTDDPMLTARGVRCPRQPLRVVVDSLAETPEVARIIACPGGQPIVAITAEAPQDRIKVLQEAGARIVAVEGGTTVDLKSLIGMLGTEGITNVLIEGGGTLAASALESKIVDKVLIFVAPKIIGGQHAKTPVEGVGAATAADALRMERLFVKRIGPDILVEAYPRY